MEHKIKYEDMNYGSFFFRRCLFDYARTCLAVVKTIGGAKYAVKQELCYRFVCLRKIY